MVGASAPPPTPVEPGNASVQTVCDRAGALTADGQPAEALALIERYREGRPTPTPSPIRRVATPSPTPTPLVDCEPERLAALDALGQERGARETPSPAGSFAKDWDRVVAGVIAPLWPIAVASAVALLALIVIARLAALLPILPFGSRSARGRGLLAWGGVALMTAGALIAVLSLTAGSWWAPLVGVALGLAGSALFASHLAGRLRVSVEVRRDGTEDLEASARVIALLREIGAAPARGLQIPIATDVTALRDAVISTPIPNPLIHMLRALIASVIATTPWRVMVALEEEGAAIVVARNGRTVAAYEIGSSLLRSATPDTPSDSGRHPAGPGDAVPATATERSALAPFLAECAASAVVVALARHYDGFEGLAGARSWRSVALHFIATARYENDAVTQRRLLARALELDPGNLLAEIALRYLVWGHVSDRAAAEPYLEWLDERISQLLARPSGARKRVSVVSQPPSSDVEWVEGETAVEGHLDIVRRLLLAYVATALNVGAGAAADPRLERNARRLVELLADDAGGAGTLRDRMRPIAALMYGEVVPTEKGTRSTVDLWLSEALTSASPSVAFNAACYLSASWQDSMPPEKKIEIETRVAERLRFALPLPRLREAAKKDPVLARHRDHAWFQDLIREFE